MSRHSTGSTDGARILIVEDEEILCNLIERNLQARNHDVRIAMTVESALKEMGTHPFDLILLDINLPDQTGWNVLRTAKSEGYLHPQEVEGEQNVLPVIVLSAVRISPHRLAEFRPLAYLPKPFPMEALLRLAAEAARRRHGDHHHGESGDTVGPRTPQPNLTSILT